MFFLFSKRNKERTLWVIFFYVLYCNLNELVTYYLFRNHINIDIDFILLALFTVIEFTFFCIYYYYALQTRFIRKALPIIFGMFLIFAFIDFFLINRMNNFDSFTTGIESIIIILLCIYYLAVQIKGNNSLFVYSTSNFWIIITFLIYLSGTFFLYILTENMMKSQSFRHQYVVINSVFNILKNILLSIAMLMKPTPTNIQKPKIKGWDDDVNTYKLKQA